MSTKSNPPTSSSRAGLRFALAQLNLTVGDFAGNLQKMKQAHARARTEGADLCIFSELAICGYPPRDLLHHSDFIEKNQRTLELLGAETKAGPAILVGFLESCEGQGAPLYNAAALYDKGKLVGVCHKALLPTYDVFDEDRYFEPAAEVKPIEWRGHKLGVTICEDVWNDSEFWPRRRYDFDPVQSLAEQGAEILINLSSSPYTIQKIALRLRMMGASAARHGLPLVCVNQVGGNDELIFDGSSFVIDKSGVQKFGLASFEEDFGIWDYLGLDQETEPSGTVVAVTPEVESALQSVRITKTTGQPERFPELTELVEVHLVAGSIDWFAQVVEGTLVAGRGIVAAGHRQLQHEPFDAAVGPFQQRLGQHVG